MKTVGIITEYNPFHNGHAYQLAAAKRMTGADYCIVIMSGSFVQRGAPAFMDKYIRTQAALANGADLVLELPVCYALGSAEYFASGAVALLDKLGVADALCFGSECGDITLLSEFATKLSGEDETFKKVLDRQLRRGLAYPSARNAALQACAPHLNGHMNILMQPNNILAIEYCKALTRRNSSIRPCTVRRAGSAYHDASLDSSFCSALAIRESVASSGSPAEVKELMPRSSYELLESHYGRTCPILTDDVSLPLHYQLLSEESEGYATYADVDSDLSDRIVKKLPTYRCFTDFCEQLKTKNRTYTRIARSLLHILLRIEKTDLAHYQSEDYIYYARMLGFREGAEPLLSAIKENGSIPLLSKLADADSLLSENGRHMLCTDIYASHIYNSLVQHKFADCPDLPSEYKRKILKY